MSPMPPTTTSSTSVVLPWVDLVLGLKGHPSCARIVAKGRRRQPRPASWDELARDISTRTGGTVSDEFLRLNFGHLDQVATIRATTTEDIGGGDAA
jgi:hypothetical protein